MANAAAAFGQDAGRRWHAIIASQLGIDRVGVGAN
jgi:hypothetical protein